MPELTKPTTMTVVAEEDWITAVIPAPTSTPKKTVRGQLFKNFLHTVARRRLKALAHHLHSVEEKGEAAEQPKNNGKIVHSFLLLYFCFAVPIEISWRRMRKFSAIEFIYIAFGEEYFLQDSVFSSKRCLLH